MAKAAKAKKASTPKVDPYLDGLMSKLMDRLGALERKMDTVIANTTVSRGPQQAPRQAAPQQQVFSSPHPMAEPKNLPRHDHRTMYEAVCADCSDPCEVPFRPSPERAIYCKPCFAKRRAEGRVHPPQARPQGPAGGSGSSAPAALAPAAASQAQLSVKSPVKPQPASSARSAAVKSKPASAKPAKKAKKK